MRFPFTEQAIAEWEQGREYRDSLWDNALSDADVTACIHKEKQAGDKVVDVFCKESGASAYRCRLLMVEDIKRIIGYD